MNWYKKAKEEVQDKDLQEYQSYGWTSIDIPKKVIDKIKAIQKTIDKDDLFVKHEGDWNYGLEDDFHITVKWGIITKDPEEVRKAVDGFQGGEVQLYDISLFENDEYDVLKIDADSDALNELNKGISDKLETKDSYPEYHPHATIAYIKSGRGKKYTNRNFDKILFSFDKIRFEDSDDKVTTINLEKSK